MTLAEHRELDADEPTDPLDERARRVHEARGRERAGAAARRTRDATHAPARDLHALPAPLHAPPPLLAGALEQVHAELLAAEPSAPARVQQGDRVLREIGKVPANERAIRDDVRARRLVFEAVGGRGAVVASEARMHAGRSDAARRRLFGRPNEGRDTLGVGGDEEIAAATHPERVAALARELLEEVDGPVHQRDHLVAGARPPVAVALGRLVAGEGEDRKS